MLLTVHLLVGAFIGQQINNLGLMIVLAIIISAIPAGLLLAYLTKDEKNIYRKYFPAIMWIIAISAAVFFTLNIRTALTLTFVFVLMLTWLKSDKFI
jgi:hypothetical protein